MAAPTAPTAALLATEGLRKAGVKGAASSDTDYTDSTTTWFQEIKNDIQMIARGRKLTPLQSSAILVTTLGVAKQTYPTDRVKDIRMELVDGSLTGIATAGGASTITLAAGHGLTTASAAGKEVVIYEGTGLSGGISQISTIVSIATNVATVFPAWDTTPDNTSKYIIIDTYKDIEGPKHINLLRSGVTPWQRGEPVEYYTQGDSTEGDFILHPPPYRSNSIPYVFRLWYYADLEKLDLSSALLVELYITWRNTWVQGIYVRKLQRLHDKKYTAQEVVYRRMLENLINKETYEHNLSDMKSTVED